MNKYFKVEAEAFGKFMVIKEVFQEDSKEARIDFLNQNLEVPSEGISKEYVDFITGEVNEALGVHRTYDNRTKVSVHTYEEALDALWEDFNHTRDAFQKLANDSIMEEEPTEDPFQIGKYVTLRKDLEDGVRYGEEFFFDAMKTLDGIYKITRLVDEFIFVNGNNGGFKYTREMFEEGIK